MNINVSLSSHLLFCLTDLQLNSFPMMKYSLVQMQEMACLQGY